MPSIMLSGPPVPGSEAPAEDGADIGFAGAGDHVFLEAAGGFDGLAVEQAFADFF